MNLSMLFLYSILSVTALLLCSCGTSPNVNQHGWNVEISPVEGKHATFGLVVRHKHSEHSGNSKYEGGMGVVASAGEGRKSDRSEWGINSARYVEEVGMKVSWIHDYYVRIEYDAKFYVTGKEEGEYSGEDDRVIGGSTRFYVPEGRNHASPQQVTEKLGR